MNETRTAAELIAYAEEQDSFLGFDREALLPFLSYEEAKPWLKPDYAGEDWPEPTPRTKEAATEALVEYMGRIGLDKAVSHRGISANRTIDKVRAWAWLAGDDEAVRLMDHAPYANYGAPKLLLICQRFSIDWRAILGAADAAIFEAMARGDVCPACLAGHESGCGE